MQLRILLPVQAPRGCVWRLAGVRRTATSGGRAASFCRHVGAQVVPPLVGCPLGNVRTLSPIGDSKSSPIGRRAISERGRKNFIRPRNYLNNDVKQILLFHTHTEDERRANLATIISLSRASDCFRPRFFSRRCASHHAPGTEERALECYNEWRHRQL